MYRYRSNWRRGIDIIVMTSKGKMESRISSGVIIPKHQDGLMEYINRTKHNVYLAKYCDRICQVTCIAPAGSAGTNMFGWFVTDTKMPDTDWSLDIGYGWFKGITVSDLSQIENYL